MPKLVYLDSSSFLTLLLGQGSHRAIRSALRREEGDGATLVSSRLLWLEARRVTVREALRGNEIGSAVASHLEPIDQLPVTDEVWERAGEIQQHVKTPHALHLATCELAGAALFTAGLDGSIHRAATSRGTPLVPIATAG